MLAALTARRDVGDHSGHAVTDEGVFENLRKFTPPKRCVFLVLVKRTDALLQSEERLVDLRTIYACLFVLV